MPGSRTSTSRTVDGPIFSSQGSSKQLDRDDRGLIQALGLDLRGVPDLPVVHITDDAQANGHGRREYHDFRLLFSPRIKSRRLIARHPEDIEVRRLTADQIDELVPGNGDERLAANGEDRAVDLRRLCDRASAGVEGETDDVARAIGIDANRDQCPTAPPDRSR